MEHLSEMSFAERITALRKEKGFTQDALANQLGITFQAVSKWENGASYPDITLLPQLAEIFGCSIDALLGHETPAQESADLEDAPSNTWVQEPAGTAGEAETDSIKAPVDPEDQAEAAEDAAAAEETEDVSDYHEAIEQMIEDHEAQYDEAAHKVEIQEAMYDENARKAEAEEASQEEQTDWEEGPCGVLDDLPWEDDGQLHVALFIGHKYIGKQMNVFKYPQIKEITFHYEGTKPLSIVSNLSVSCNIVNGSVTAGANVTCGEVSGGVSAGGNATVNGDVAGSASAGGILQCGNVSNNASAGGSITCGSINGNAKAGGKIVCENGTVNGTKSSLSDAADSIHKAAMEFSKQMTKGFKNFTKDGKTFRFHFDDSESQNDRDEEDYEVQCDSLSNFNAGDRAKFHCDTVEGDVSMGDGSRLKCDTIEGYVMMADNCGLHCDSIGGDVTLGAGGSLSCESIEGSIQVDALHMGDRAKLECDSIEGSVSFGNDGRLTCDGIEGGVAMGDNANIDCDAIDGGVTINGNCTLSCDSIDKGVSMQSGSVQAETIDQLAIGVGQVTCESIDTVLIGAGGSVTIKAEGMPEVKYQG